jgi:rare lipoprotein A (peptidoglycan hydrolase)
MCQDIGHQPGRGREIHTNQRKYVLKQNKHRSIKAAILTAALAGACVTGAVAPSFAADQTDDFGAAYARGSHGHLRHARHLRRHHDGGYRDAGRAHRGGAQLTYYYSSGKLRLVNADRGGGLDGVASVYHDRITANGEHMNPSAMTAAHKSLPIGSIVTVHNKRNGRSVTVRINDRGPYVTGRVVDLSPGAARVIGMDGLAPVYLTVNGRAGRHRFS